MMNLKPKFAGSFNEEDSESWIESEGLEGYTDELYKDSDYDSDVEMYLNNRFDRNEEGFES